ncbi:hypothetical protein WJX73_008757 [Symbiochloris irregularis]|uniref:ABC1 atypical kinase-like domain-containing protein n=1 Tax=Symbiochloris irregularis TaxID=706552 RepID=A0AAW1NJA1_9CHLO
MRCLSTAAGRSTHSGVFRQSWRLWNQLSVASFPYWRWMKPQSHLRAIVNAMSTAGYHVQRLLPMLLAQALFGTRPALAYYDPRSMAHVEVQHRPGIIRRALKLLSDACCELARAAVLAVLFTPVLVTMPFALHMGWQRARWLRMFRVTLEAAGPAFMKWGQWAATRADLFPPDMCQELETLQSRAPVHSLQYTRKAIQQALGAPLENFFDDFEGEPIASGSIGQVHRARLSVRGAKSTGIEPGTVVAVKVRHPNVTEVIARDFGLMMRAARIAAWLPSLASLRLQDSLEQFSAPLREQVDLALEARHLWQFNFNFRKRKGVRFPLPVYPLVEASVLVETFEAGESIKHYISSPGNRFNSKLAQLGSEAMLHMMLVDSFIHSDLHPGNILVALDPAPQPLLASAASLLRFSGLAVPPSWQQPCIVLLDVGMATHLSEEDQAHMLELFTAFAVYDGDGMAKAILAFSGDKQACPSPSAFAAQLDDELQVVKRSGASQRAGSNGADALSSAIELVRKHQVSLPGHICAVVMTTLVLEGWSSALDPDHSVLEQVDRVLSLKESSWGRRIGQAVDQLISSSSITTPVVC